MTMFHFHKNVARRNFFSVKCAADVKKRSAGGCKLV